MLFTIRYRYPQVLAGEIGYMETMNGEVILYRADHTVYDPPNGVEYEIIAPVDLRVQKEFATVAEALRRLQLLIPLLASINEIDALRELWLSIAPAARVPTVTMTSVINIYNYARDQVIWLRNTATDVQVEAYDPVTDSNWPS